MYQRYLALRRVFKRRESDMLRDTFKGLLRRFTRARGMQALRQRRREPVTLAIVNQLLCNAEEGDKKVQEVQWSFRNWI